MAPFTPTLPIRMRRCDGFAASRLNVASCFFAGDFVDVGEHHLGTSSR